MTPWAISPLACSFFSSFRGLLLQKNHCPIFPFKSVVYLRFRLRMATWIQTAMLKSASFNKGLKHSAFLEACISQGNSCALLIVLAGKWPELSISHIPWSNPGRSCHLFSPEWLQSSPAILFQQHCLPPNSFSLQQPEQLFQNRNVIKHLSGLLLFMRILDIIYKTQHGLALSSCLVMSYIVLSPAFCSSHWGLFQWLIVSCPFLPQGLCTSFCLAFLLPSTIHSSFSSQISSQIFRKVFPDCPSGSITFTSCIYKPYMPSWHVCMLSCFSRVWLFATPWTSACQAPLSMGFPRQEYWSGLPCPPPGDLPDPGIKPESSESPTL